MKTINLNISTIKRVLWGIAFLGLFILINHTILRGQWIRDIELYFEYSRNILAGQIPYFDFAAEYPPAAFLPMLPPQLLAQESLDQYRVWFAVENCILVCLGAILGLQLESNSAPKLNIQFKVWRRLKWILPLAISAVLVFWLSPLLFLALIILPLIVGITRSTRLTSQQKQTLGVYGIYILILSPLWLWRYDIFVAVIILLSLVSLRQSRFVFSGLCVGLGILAKLYPVMMLPPIALYLLVQRAYAQLLKFGLAVVGICGLGTLPFLLVDRHQFFSFLGYHQERPLQLESLPAGVAILLHQLDILDVEKILSHSSESLVFPGDRLILSLLPIIFVVGCCLSSGWLGYCFSKQYQKQTQIPLMWLMESCLLLHLVFMLSNKVFSPQYVIWLLPFMICASQRSRIIFLWVCLLTILVYPTFYAQLLSSPMVALLLNARNGLMLVWAMLVCNQLKPRASERIP
ncbi:MAG: DUF2029 domain-containing protein [Spirulina sp. SIO3F2]|nr:DUF2029 domain-containing protein [Spirulina sp. SIO3F2]